MTTRIEQPPVLSYTGSNSANSMSFAGPIVSRTIAGVSWQVCAYWARASTTNVSYANARLVLGKRVLPWGEWSWYIYNGTDQPLSLSVASDSHNTCPVEIDGDGYVHVWYDHHGDALKYRKSTTPLATWTGGLSDLLTLPFSGAVTYPVPFRSPQGKLYYVGRHWGGTENSVWYFFEYDETTATWSACAGTSSSSVGSDTGAIIDGVANARGPYVFLRPDFSPDWDGAGTGFLHFAWTLRRDNALTNSDVYHMRWNGTAWSKIDGSAQTMPASLGNVTAVWTVPESEELFNQSGMCVDGNGRPHISLIKSDGTRHQLYDLYHNGTAWALQQLTSYATANTWSDYGRTCCACDQTTNEVFFWGTHLTLETGIQQWKSAPGDFTSWTKTTFLNSNVGNHEPTIDWNQWRDSRVVCMWVHRGVAATDVLATPRIVTRLPKGRSSAWVLADWARKHPITIDATKVGTGGVTGYTAVLARANFANEVCAPAGANRAQEDGGDLRFFTDAALTTPIACHIVSFGYDSVANAGDAHVEVRVGPLTLSDTTGTTIYVAYSATGTKHQPFVDETGGAAAANESFAIMAPLDSSAGNSINVDEQGFGWNRGRVAYGPEKLENGAEYAGATGHTLVGRTLGIGSAFSVAAWVDVTGSVASSPFIFGSDSNSTNRGMQFRVNTTGRVQLLRFSSANAVTSDLTGTTDLRSAGFKRVVAEWSSTLGARILVNGVQEATNANTVAQHDDDLLTYAIGHRHRSASPFGDQYLVGSVDQLELHTARRGDAWWVTDFNNQDSPATFATAGAASDAEPPASTAPALSLPGVIDIGTTSARPQVTLTY